jgi:YggT family protein
MDVIFHILMTAVLVRLLVPNTGQMYYNKPYQALVRLTDIPLRLKSVPARYHDAFAHALVRLGQDHAIVISRPGISSAFPAIVIPYASSGYASALHCSVTGFLKFLLLVSLLGSCIIWASSSQSITNHVLFILHRFLAALTFSLTIGRWRGEVHEKPLQAFAAAAAPLSALFVLSIYLGTAYGLIPSGDTSAGQFVIRGLLMVLLMALNLAGMIIPLMIIRFFLGWVSAPQTTLTRILFAMTEPFLAPFRRLRLQSGTVDFSPIMAFMIVYLALHIASFALNFLYRTL